MSQQFETALVKQFHSNVERLLQQQGSILKDCVRNEPQASEEQFWDQIGATTSVEVFTKNPDSPQVDTPHARRRVTMRKFHTGDFLDSFEKAQALVDPTNIYVQNFVDALSRDRDDVIINAFFADAFTGKAGATTTVFPAGNIIPVNFGGTDIGLTIEKLIEAQRLLLSFQNQKGRQPWYIAITSRQLSDLLNNTKVQSADYNSIKALVAGDVDTFMGFKFKLTERLTLSATHQAVPVWVKDGVLHATGIEITTRVAEREDKSFNWYAYARAMFGATRMQEGKVLQILCDVP